MLDYILDEYGISDIALKELDYGFIVGFENYLRCLVPKLGQSNIGNNKAMKHIKRLRRMVSLAYRMEWLNRVQTELKNKDKPPIN